jgi:TolB protein
MTGRVAEGQRGRGRTARSARVVVLLLVCVAARLVAQDTVRVGITYQPGVRPGLVVLPAPGLDSVHAIVARDLDFSDRFEVIPLTQPPSGTGAQNAPLNYAFYRSLGASLAVELSPASGNFVRMRLYDLAAARIGGEVTLPLERSGVGEGRLSIHALSDEIVRMATGQPGIAATRILFLNHEDKRIWRVDSDGGGLTAASPAGVVVMSAVWSPDGSRIAYSQFSRDGAKPIVVQTLASGTRTVLPTTTTKQNITPAFSPDGRNLLYAGMSETGTALYVLNAQDLCCVERLTTGRFAENFSPAYSPDGRRIVFVSTRAGGQQIYSMAADGTDQELLVPFDYGETGNSNAPEWSPDGTAIAFHREVSRAPQVWIFDLAGRRLRQLSSSGRNEDPSWAPDSRHLVFISDRTGRRQLFVVDTETNRVRQIMTAVTARLPAWSRPLARSH